MGKMKETEQNIVNGGMVVNRHRWSCVPVRHVRGFKTYIYHAVTWYDITGNRKRKEFQTEPQAWRFFREQLDRYVTDQRRQNILQKRIGEKAKRLSTDALEDAARAIDILAGRASLEEVARAYVKMYPGEPGETAEETAKKYLEDMERHNAKPESIKDKRVKLGVFCRDHGKVPTASINEALLSEWCRNKGFSVTTAHAYAGAVRTVLNFHLGKKRRMIRQDERLPLTWSVERVKLLFSKAEEIAPDILPAMTLLWFCGLRPHEVLRVEWRHIDLVGKMVNLLPGVSKTRTCRLVDIPDNAVEWLKAYKPAVTEGNVVKSPGMFRKKRGEVLSAAGIDGWDKDVARHTYATIHYKTFQSVDRTREQLGHFGESYTFRRHYKGQPITTEQAAEYWKIMPAKKAMPEEPGQIEEQDGNVMQKMPQT